MKLLLDSSGLLAAIDSRQEGHQEAREALESYVASGLLFLSPFILAELDYMVLTRMGLSRELDLLGEVARGTYQLLPFSNRDVAEAVAVIEQYDDLNLGLADASLVVLANRHAIHDVLTFDERHFRTVSGPGGRPFRLLPADL